MSELSPSIATDPGGSLAALFLEGERDRLLGIAFGVLARQATGSDDVQLVDRVEPQADLVVVVDLDDESG